MERKKQIKLLYKGHTLDYIPSVRADLIKDFTWIQDSKLVDPEDRIRLFTECFNYDDNEFFLSQGVHIANVVGYWLMDKKVYNKLKVWRKS